MANNTDMYRMTEDGFYGKAIVPSHAFEKLNQKYFISRSSDTTKYMCANDAETAHLESLGIDASSVVCDWYKIVLDTDSRASGDGMDNRRVD